MFRRLLFLDIVLFKLDQILFSNYSHSCLNLKFEKATIIENPVVVKNQMLLGFFHEAQQEVLMVGISIERLISFPLPLIF